MAAGNKASAVQSPRHPAGAARRAADRGHVRHRRQRHVLKKQDKDEIEAKSNALMSASHKSGEMMYAKAQAGLRRMQAAARRAAGASERKQPKDDGVVDGLQSQARLTRGGLVTPPREVPGPGRIGAPGRPGAAVRPGERAFRARPRSRSTDDHDGKTRFLRSPGRRQRTRPKTS